MVTVVVYLHLSFDKIRSSIIENAERSVLLCVY